MACKASFELHHNFPKLADEAGFTFNTHRPRVHIEWSKIKLIDIESLVRNRNFTIVEQHLNDILDCVIDLEFDVRILDEGFLKIFRLAQLAVEYQQFCRHYLDRSVFVLREEMASLLQELELTKTKLKEKEEEIRKGKRKIKQSFRNPLPYGNENIARMILNTLNQNRSEIIPLPTQIDTLNYNKCNHCDKVFLNQLYLQSHVSRRHGNTIEMPQRDKEETINNNSEINNDIVELKLKLKQMEEFILNSNKKEQTHSNNTEINYENKSYNKNVSTKEFKDAEVGTNNDINESDERKNEDLEKYNKEINLLRTQIFDIINNKEKHNTEHSENELKMMEQLHETIKKQGDEILSLKQELLNGNARETDERLKIEAQLKYWSNKAEIQSSNFKELLQKLNDVETVAQEYRAKAESEKEKSTELQNLLQQHLNNLQTKQVIQSNKSTMISENMKAIKSVEPKVFSINKNEDEMLKSLQQRAQELLNIDHLNSSATSNTDDSNSIEHSDEHRDTSKNKLVLEKTRKQHIKNEKQNMILRNSLVTLQKNQNVQKVKNNSQKKIKNGPISQKNTRKEGQSYTPNSPVKVVRAKITEEVNNRLVSLGIDPLKKKLPKQTFLKKRMLLQEQQEIKMKKLPFREQVAHSIIANLDTDAYKAFQTYTEKNGYTYSNKSSKALKMSSVLSNVKTKALSLIKSNEIKENSEKSYDDTGKGGKPANKSPQVTYNAKNNMQEDPTDNIINTHLLQNMTQIKSDEETISPNKDRKNARKYNFNATGNNELFTNNDYSDSSDQDYTDQKKTSKQSNIFNLLKSPVRQPSNTSISRVIDKNDIKDEGIVTYDIDNDKNKDEDSSDDLESLVGLPPRKSLSEENIHDSKITKGVLKTASSTSSLHKKKVLFDMDAIQMKSVSASPSQSTTEKSDNNEKYELGISNLDTEEWDLSSIENLVLPEISKEETTLAPQPATRQSPKFIQLRQTVESKLMGRNQTLSTTPIGGVDVLSAPLQKRTSFGGSNTSLGSSILDDTDNSSLQKQNI